MSTEKNEQISRAVLLALNQRNLSISQVAEILGLKSRAVSKRIRSGNFPNEKAAEWSAALDIPMEVFLEGATFPSTKFLTLEQVYSEVQNLKQQVEELKKTVNELKRLKDIVTEACRADD